MADMEMGRFLRAQFKHALICGYPRMSTFARDIARGDIGLPPHEPEDPVMDAMGVFYFQWLRQMERRILSERYLGEGSIKSRAKRLSMSQGAFERRCDRLLERCKGFLEGCGLYAKINRSDTPEVVSRVIAELTVAA